MSSTSSAAVLRLMSDLKSIKHAPPGGCSASPVSDDNMFVWSATVMGPDDTPWEGGVFSLRITFPDTYPAKPPKVQFVTEIYHPNVFSNGQLCLDIIQDAWSPCHSVASLLASIQSLLTDPNVTSPANQEAALMFQNDRQAYNRRVRRLAQKSIES